MDYLTPLYDHSGKWKKNFDSIFDPGQKTTWPEFIAQMTLWNRQTYIKAFKISKGKGWYIPIGGQVRRLIQQAYIICNFFEHPETEPLVIVAFKNVFRNNRIMKLGRPTKTRTSKSVTQVEKDILKYIDFELTRLIRQRDSLKTVIMEVKTENISFRKEEGSNKNRFDKLIELEKGLKNGTMESNKTV